MSYLTIGYDGFLSKPLLRPDAVDSPVDINYKQINSAGEEIKGGQIQSLSKQTTLSFDDERLTFTDGQAERVVVGKQPDGTYGVSVYDANGVLVT